MGVGWAHSNDMHLPCSHAPVQLSQYGECLAVPLAPHELKLHLGGEGHELLHGNAPHYHTLHADGGDIQASFEAMVVPLGRFGQNQVAKRASLSTSHFSIADIFGRLFALHI